MGYDCNKVYNWVEHRIGNVFAAYGRFLSRHPWKFIVIGILVNSLLGIGMIRLNYVTDVKTVYTPIDSQSSKDSETIAQTFPDLSGSNFIGIQMPDLGRYGEVIAKPKLGNIFNTDFLNELKSLYSTLLSISTEDENGGTVQLTSICAKRFSNCAIDGDIFVEDEFQTAVNSGSVSCPYFVHSTRGPIYYEQIIGGANVTNGILYSATMLIFRVNLRTDSDYYRTAAKNWQDSFKTKMENYKATHFAISYAHTDSLSEELDKNVSGDIVFFSITFTIMITYACLATMTARCDPVGQRSNLGFAGVLAAGLAIVSSFGIVSACGVDFVSIVGVVPFLIIGVDDMFLLMSGITETDYDADVEERIGQTMRTSGVSITITSLTDLLAFAAGSSSVFLSVRNFCIYSGVAVIFCYINQATIFMSCIAINEKRTAANRHFATCFKLPVKHADMGSSCHTYCCTGRKPKNQSESESYLDRLPRWLVPKIVLKWPMKIVIIVLFATYLAVSIYGITQLEEGLVLKNLVAEDSYYQRYREWLDANFSLGTSVSFVFTTQLEYSKSDTQTSIQNFIADVKKEVTIQNNFEINWLTEFKTSVDYDDSTEAAFVSGLKTFLAVPSNSRFENDVVIDSTNNVIKASRIHLMSESIKNSQEQGKFMLRMRELSSESSVSVIAFSPAFIFYEQYVAILSQTLQTVGIAVAMVFFVTIIFMPHPLLLIYVNVTVAMITTGIFGFLSFLGLTLSAITMIHIILSIGFSVDFAAHICHGYMISKTDYKLERYKRENQNDNIINSINKNLEKDRYRNGRKWEFDMGANVKNENKRHGYGQNERKVERRKVKKKNYENFRQNEDKFKDKNERMKAAIIRSGAPVFHGAISSLLGVIILAFAKSYIFYSFFQVMSLVVTFGVLHALLFLPVVLSVIGPSSSDGLSQDSAQQQRNWSSKKQVFPAHNRQGSPFRSQTESPENGERHYNALFIQTRQGSPLRIQYEPPQNRLGHNNALFADFPQGSPVRIQNESRSNHVYYNNALFAQFRQESLLQRHHYHTRFSAPYRQQSPLRGPHKLPKNRLESSSEKPPTPPPDYP